MIAIDLGVIDYEAGLNLQHRLHEQRVNSRGDDILLLLEHTPVITIGRSGIEQDLLATEAELAARGIPVKKLGRGGKITCHYPGQLVAYPIMDLKNGNLDIPDFVNRLEEVIIATLADVGLKGERIEKLRGIFVSGNKIASIGVEIRHQVSMHGISLNVFEDNGLYGYFVPCGITDRGIEFIERCCPDGTQVSMDWVKRAFLSHFTRIFHLPGTVALSLQEFEDSALNPKNTNPANHIRQDSEGDGHEKENS
ncbi:MAG: lipoyl(octanoyl) transferase LipB [Desulfomonilia bacterium]|nr:lipoyl(octanoyl) transferase LipB [Desulfomonilia bacterium]